MTDRLPLMGRLFRGLPDEREATVHHLQNSVHLLQSLEGGGGLFMCYLGFFLIILKFPLTVSIVSNNSLYNY